MNRRLQALAERRSVLLSRAAEQRRALARDVAPWQARLAVADQGIAVFRYLSRRPLLIGLAALLLVAWRPRRVGSWLQGGWAVWQIGRKLRGG